MAVGIAVTILAKGAGSITITGTPQLQNLTSTGVVAIKDFVTGTPQLQNLTSTGVVSISQTVTGTPQLQNLTSTGVVDSGEVAATETNTGGSFVFKLEQERYRQEDERRKRKEKKIKARKIADKLVREIALAEREIEDREARDNELSRLAKLVESNKSEILTNYGKIAKTVETALADQSFANMEILERKLNREMEEVEFLLMATRIILDG